MPAILTVTTNPALDLSFEVDQLKPGVKLRGSAPVLQPGGGGINVARAATTLAADVIAVWIGGGHDAAKLQELLAAESVRHRHVPAAAEPRRSLHIDERATGAMYRFVLPGPDITQQEGERLAEGVASCAGTSYVVISGSLPPSLPTDYYAHLAARAPKGARVVLDTSGAALDRGLAGHVYLAKPNRNELSRLAGRALTSLDDVASAARELIRAERVEVVAVSLGADGLLLVTRERVEQIVAPRVTPVSEVGAGDSTVAGIVVGLARGWALPDAIRLGVAAGTAAVLTPGTDLCRREDTDRLYAQIQATARA